MVKGIQKTQRVLVWQWPLLRWGLETRAAVVREINVILRRVGFILKTGKSNAMQEKRKLVFVLSCPLCWRRRGRQKGKTQRQKRPVSKQG